MKLNGKKVFITASGQGIGRAITERFIKEKATVFATDINYELIKDIQSEKKELDVMNKSELQTSISNFNPDILINCAGINIKERDWDNINENDWDKIFQVNVFRPRPRISDD